MFLLRAGQQESAGLLGLQSESAELGQLDHAILSQAIRNGACDGLQGEIRSMLGGCAAQSLANSFLQSGGLHRDAAY